MSSYLPTIALLCLSNVFMTTAWYWHLKGGPAAVHSRPLLMVIGISWLLAGIEYSLAVDEVVARPVMRPAMRMR